MAGWLESLKGAVNNVATYDLLVANIEHMERERETLKTHITLLNSHVEILSSNLSEVKSQLGEARERLTLVETENTKLRKENADWREKEKFDVVDGVAFKWEHDEDKYDPNPRCPNCFNHLTFSHHDVLRNHPMNYLCTCGYKIYNTGNPSQLIRKLT